MQDLKFGIRYEEHQLDKNGLTIFYSHEVDGNMNADDVEIESKNFDRSEFADWVLEDAKENVFDGAIPNGMTFQDYIDTLYQSQITELVKEFLQVVVSEGEINPRQYTFHYQLAA